MGSFCISLVSTKLIIWVFFKGNDNNSPRQSEFPKWEVKIKVNIIYENTFDWFTTTVTHYCEPKNCK